MTVRFAYYAGIGAILVFACIVRIIDPAPVAQLRALVFDAYQQFSPREYDPQSPVRIIDIDDESIRKTGQWPWPRTVIAKLVDNLRDAGAVTIAFDIVFSEPDRSSPENSLSFLPPVPEAREIRRMAEALPAFDDIMANSLSTVPVVLGVVLNDNAKTTLPEEKAAFAFAGDDPKQFVPHYGGSLRNLTKFETAAKGIGALNWTPDSDQIIRRIPMLFQSRDKLVPSLSAEALRVAQGASTYVVKSSNASGEQAYGVSTGLVSMKIGAGVVRTDAEGQYLIRFTPTDRRRFVPAWRVLENRLEPGEIEGKILLIGTSAAGLFDLRTTPLDPSVPGVEVHAQAIEQILAGITLLRPDYALGLELGFMLVVGFLLAALILMVGAEWSGMLGVTAIGAVVLVSWQLFLQKGLLLDPFYPSAVAIGIYMFGTLAVYLQTEGERRRVKTAFSRYMSPELVSRLADDPSGLVLGGEMRDMTVMFCDIRGFTTISEGLDAQDLTRFVNRFLTPMTDIILQERGTIDKYMGDCIMAFWNAPIDDADHDDNACRAASRMMQALDELNGELRKEAESEGRTYQPINIGIGISTGECCVGNMGSDQRFDYSVIGDNVNIASRLEGQSKTYGVTAVLAESTAENVDGFACLELDLINVKGKTEAIRIFALAGDRERADSPSFISLRDSHYAMLTAYRSKKWEAASSELAKCRLASGAEFKELYDLYETRISEYRANPPSDDWDGVYVALTK